MPSLVEIGPMVLEIAEDVNVINDDDDDLKKIYHGKLTWAFVFGKVIMSSVKT